jgi:hypothetical protein
MAKRPLPQAAVDASTLHHVAREAKRTEPPAGVATPEHIVPINLKIREGLATALAQRAFPKGITQKQIIARACSKDGLPVNPSNLEDRSGRRWRPPGHGQAT